MALVERWLKWFKGIVLGEKANNKDEKVIKFLIKLGKDGKNKRKQMDILIFSCMWLKLG